MGNFKPPPPRSFVCLALSALLLPAYPAPQKADKKKSQADYQQALLSDKAGHREEAIAAYSSAIEADPSNGDAWRARAEDYLAAGDRAKMHRKFAAAELPCPQFR